MATARRKGIGFELRVSCGYDITGKRIRMSTMWYPPTGMTEKQIAKELEKQKLLFDDKVKGRGQMVNGDIRLAEFMDIWWENHALGLARKTYSVYEIYTPRIIQALGHMKLSKISHIHINRFLENLGEAGINKNVVKDKNGNVIADRKLSARTIYDYHKLINNILNKAVEWGYLDQNPGKLAITPKVNYKEAKHLSEKDTQRMLDLLNGETIQHRTMIYILIFTGLRRAELLGLRWSDINFDTQTITVEQSLQYFAPGQYEIKDPKTRSGRRQFTVSKSICELLLVYKAWQDEIKQVAGDTWIETDAVFTRTDGTHCLPNSLTQWFKKFITRHGLPQVTLHSLRHTHASLLIAEGIDIATVSRRLGHSKVSITLDIYTHSLESRDRKAAEILDNLLTINDDKLLKISDFEHLRGKSGGNPTKSAENA